MVKQTIQIFARVKPTKFKTGHYDVDEDDEGSARLMITVPRELADGFINNKKENYKFRFQKVFNQRSSQDDVFDHVAKPVIDNVLQGYNGTIFAYGQTGSGKTFTITGGAERYVDRGIIPRSLSYVFEMMAQNPELSFTLHISYLEIYNESGFDLLDPKHEAARLEDLPKVNLMEDSDQNIHLKNLSVHQAASEEEALNLLFLGDTNRMIAETPMNQASTRSHCIFTMHLTSRETGSATIRRAKLHLVDLAGSERVAKSGVNGVLLTEAKYINLSLHYLEQVIIALSEKNRQHIPYRNSMMTSVLRDSLGGNCMTTMIATCAIDKKNIDETISTCRFAQRVAMIKNDVLLNEELDPKLMIMKLKKEIHQLKEELAMATGEQRTDELGAEEIKRCEDAVTNYLDDSDPDAVLSIGADMRKIHTCFSILKRLVLEKPPSRVSPQRETTPTDTGPYTNAETQKLKDLVMQRDNEINILVNMLKKEKKRAADAMSLAGSRGDEGVQMTQHREGVGTSGSQRNGHDSNHYSRSASVEGRKSLDKRQLSGISREMEERTKTKILGKMSLGRQEAFDIFIRDYEHNQKIEDNKRILKQKYAEAKVFGEKLNQTKNSINHIKSKMEQHRMQQAMQGLTDPDTSRADEIEEQLRERIEDEKSKYKQTFTHLRGMKNEIEHLQHLLENAKVKLMKDFELWWADQSAKLQNQGVHTSVQGSVRSAWNTPPLTPLQKHNSVSPVNPQESLFHASASSHSQRSADHSRNIPLTGDSKADADIMAFVKARQNLLQKVTHEDR